MRAAGLALVLLAAGCGTTVDGTPVSASKCAPAFFGVPGSGQGALNKPPKRLPPGISAPDAASYGTTVARLKADLQAVAGSGLGPLSAIDYPAIPVTQYVGAGGLTGDLDASEAVGVTKLVAAIHASYTNGCPGRPVLLAGYSQGAEVVIQAVLQLTGTEQAGVTVALFGNPSYRPGTPGDFPASSDGSGIRPTFRGVAFVLPPDVRARTIDVCAPGDPVCGVDPDVTSLPGRVTWVLAHVTVHTRTYADASKPYAQTAAQFLWQHRVR